MIQNSSDTFSKNSFLIAPFSLPQSRVGLSALPLCCSGMLCQGFHDHGIGVLHTGAWPRELVGAEIQILSA